LNTTSVFAGSASKQHFDFEPTSAEIHHLHQKPRSILLIHAAIKLHYTTMSSPLDQKTTPLYQKDGTLQTHTSSITSLAPLSSLPPETQSLFKPPPDSTPFVITTPATIFHAQGGGQPSDTGTIASKTATFQVHSVRWPDAEQAILHMGDFEGEGGRFEVGEEAVQKIDWEKRVLHSRLHTAGHVIGLAVNLLVKDGKLDKGIVDGKASHYPSAAFVEFSGLIPGTAKGDIQEKVDRMYHPLTPTSSFR
jgi:hypothetical protein